MASQISSSLPGIFQNAFNTRLLQNSQVSSLASSGGLGYGMVGTNPLNPLQGASAVTGLNQFVDQLMYTNQLRQLGYLPSSNNNAYGSPFGLSGGSAMSAFGSQDAGSQLMGMLLSLLSMLQGLVGGGQPQQQFVAPPPQLGFGGGMESIFTGAQQPQQQLAFPQAQPGFGGANIFQTIGDRFAGIDSAINSALGGIFNTLPLAKL